MDRDLKGTVGPGGILAGDFKCGAQAMGATMGLSGEAGNAGLDFFTSTGVISDKAPWGDIQEVFYELKAPTDRNQAGMDLVRCVNHNLLATTTQTPETQWLMGNVQTLQFDCYDGTQWQNHLGYQRRQYQPAGGGPNSHSARREAGSGAAAPATDRNASSRWSRRRWTNPCNHRRVAMRSADEMRMPDPEPEFESFVAGAFAATRFRARHRALDRVRAGQPGAVFCELDELRAARLGQPGVRAWRPTRPSTARPAIINYLLTTADRQWLQRRLPDPERLSMQGRAGRRRPFLADRTRHQ